MAVSYDFYELSTEQQTLMIDWLKENFTPISGINPRHSCYGLKQKFSRLQFYVSDEQFATAMELADFKADTKGCESSSQFRFNISQKSKFFML